MKSDKDKVEIGKKARQAFVDLADLSMMIFSSDKKRPKEHRFTQEQFKHYNPKKITIH